MFYQFFVYFHRFYKSRIKLQAIGVFCRLLCKHILSVEPSYRSRFPVYQKPVPYFNVIVFHEENDLSFWSME